MAIEKISILGSSLSICDEYSLLEEIKKTVNTDQKIFVLSGNVHAYNLAYNNSWMRTLLNQANIVRIDGTGVVLGARLLGYKPLSRMTWADFAWRLAEFSEEHDYSLFFLGGRQGIANKAAERLKAHHPNLKVVGIHHGYFDKTPESNDTKVVINSINAVQPNILIVGFGMPVQERWIMENRQKIRANVVFTGGAVFDYLSGELRRAPKWMTNNGLEWLGRLVIEPKRLWKRYLFGNPLFFYRILLQRFGILRYH
jgi:N-acetylglucosaminyldiphosphoundecaprenol N-acetyl-beta-D-mannosaminyltransferase